MHEHSLGFFGLHPCNIRLRPNKMPILTNLAYISKIPAKNNKKDPDYNPFEKS